jgi:hypothetical protein
LTLEIATQQDIDELYKIRAFMLPTIHAILTIFTQISNNDRVHWEEVKQGFNFLAMVLYVTLILNCSLGMTFFVFPLPAGISKEQSLQFESAFIWLEIEQLVFLATLMSNVFFLLFRTCIRHKLNLSMIDERRQLPNIDTLMAVKDVANAFHAQFVPLFVNTVLMITPTGDNSGLQDQLRIIMICNWISLACIFFLIFVPWKKGPAAYQVVSPYIFYIVMFTNYVLIPVGNIVLSAYFTLNPNYDLKQKPLESWIIFFTIVCFARLVEYFFSIKRQVLDDAKVFMSTRKLL